MLLYVVSKVKVSATEWKKMTRRHFKSKKRGGPRVTGRGETERKLEKQRVRQRKWPKRQPEDGKARSKIIHCENGCGGFADSSSTHYTAF